jgi:hypothetical protein
MDDANDPTKFYTFNETSITEESINAYSGGTAAFRLKQCLNIDAYLVQTSDGYTCFYRDGQYLNKFSPIANWTYHCATGDVIWGYVYSFATFPQTPGPKYLPYGYAFFETEENTLGGGDIYELLLQPGMSGVFNTILVLPDEYKVETSVGLPTVPYFNAYSNPSTTADLYASFTNGIDDFNTISTSGILDSRTFYINNPSGFYTQSGYLSNFGYTYVGTVGSGILSMIPVISGTGLGNLDYLPSITIENFSGLVTHLEASKDTQINPYLFTSILGSSGVSTELGNLYMSFYQRDPTMSNFVEYTDTLPSTEITIIRLDDKI